MLDEFQFRYKSAARNAQRAGKSPGQEEGKAHMSMTCKTCGLYVWEKAGTEDQGPGLLSQLLLSCVMTLGCIFLSGDLRFHIWKMNLMFGALLSAQTLLWDRKDLTGYGTKGAAELWQRMLTGLGGGSCCVL